MNKVSRVGLAVAALLLAVSGAPVAAQSFCASDGVPRPVALLERFVNADCEACWSDPQTPAAQRGELALDWIVPGARGEDAPLSAVAVREGLARLEALRRSPPPGAQAARQRPARGAHRLRVAHGLPFNGYLGASIELKPGSGGPWQAWLLLVESLPIGAEGSPVARNLVRNVLQVAWSEDRTLSKEERARRFESRAMSIPEGASPDRLRVVGWVEDGRGRIRAIAESRCAAPASKG